MWVDYIITGQGICGTFLSWYLITAGKKVLVIDEPNQFSSSKIASGVMNPVTGRRIVRTWMIEELMPFAWDAYSSFGNELNIELIKECDILDFHPSPQMQQAFKQRQEKENDFLHDADETEKLEKLFRFNYGVGKIAPCYLVNLRGLLERWRTKLLSQQNLIEDHFNWNDCIIKDGHINWKNISAEKIINCEGAPAKDDPWFSLLPFALNKGEAIIAEIPDLPSDFIYKQGLSIVPWETNTFWIGSTYEWNYSNVYPTPFFRKKVEEQLNYWLRLPYKITDHFAGERPATLERRPFVGLHPKHPSIGILNGMGTKGCSLAPYFARQLADHLLYQKPLNPLAHVQRFAKTLMGRNG